ncbi:MAG TPA: peptidylprolyl isomerase [Phycisphaerae bacterium]|nr:peptidylprolyl isomerase [Phycisphaerae bacterium]HRW52663.1 peptidylprolyl isomerase [Phycisphaerae bacterium]
MKGAKILFALSCLVLIVPGMLTADDVESGTPETPLAQRVRAVLRVDQKTIAAGGPVMVEFVLQNLTSEPVDLRVPGALASKEPTNNGMGLPLEHVFSGPRFRALEVTSELNPQLGDRVVRKPQYPVPTVKLAPYGTIGLRFDVTRFYPALHQVGTYVLNWRPYGGELETGPVTIQVISYKEAVIDTDMGRMRMQLLYDKAPRTVENFIQLVDERFYNNRLIHTIVPGSFLLTGCPNDNGTGKRKDGKTLEPEFNDTPFDVGTVAMALIEGDPNSGSSQFFVSLARLPSWDGHYTAFGRIVGPESLAVLQRIAATPIDENQRPRQPIRIRSITIVAPTSVVRANP